MGLASILVGASVIIGGVLLAIFAPGVLNAIWSVISIIVSSIWSMISVTFQALPVPMKMIFGVLLASVILIPGVNFTMGVGNSCSSEGVLTTRDPIVGIFQEIVAGASSLKDLAADDQKYYAKYFSHDYIIVPNGVKKQDIFLVNNDTCYWLNRGAYNVGCVQDFFICKKVRTDSTNGQCYMKLGDLDKNPQNSGFNIGSIHFESMSMGSVLPRKFSSSSCNSCIKNTLTILGATIPWFGSDCTIKDDVVDALQYWVTPTATPSLLLLSYTNLNEDKMGLTTIDKSELDMIQKACPVVPTIQNDESGSWLELTDGTNKIWIFDSTKYDYLTFIADRIDTSFRPTDDLKGNILYSSFIFDSVVANNPTMDTSVFAITHSSSLDGVIQKKVIGDAIGLSCDLNYVKNPDAGYSLGIQVFGIRNVFTWSTFVGAFVVFLLFTFVGYIAKHS
jgi:hypothetical protein